jgi:hypothetical protein
VLGRGWADDRGASRGGRDDRLGRPAARAAGWGEAEFRRALEIAGAAGARPRGKRRAARR